MYLTVLPRSSGSPTFSVHVTDEGWIGWFVSFAGVIAYAA